MPANYVKGTKLKIPLDIANQDAIKNKNEFAPGTTRLQRFTKQVVDVLKFNYDYKTFRANYHAGSWWWFSLTRYLHVTLVWFSYLLQVCFPFITGAFLVAVYVGGGYCWLHVGGCSL